MMKTSKNHRSPGCYFAGVIASEYFWNGHDSERTLLKFDLKSAFATTWANQVLRHLWTVFIGFAGTCLFSLRMQFPCCMLAGVSHIAPDIVYNIITFCVCNIHMFLVKNQKKRFLCALKSVDRLQTVPCNISSALFAACSLHAFYRKFCIFSAFLLVFRYFRHVLHVFGHVLNVFAFFAMFFSIFWVRLGMFSIYCVFWGIFCRLFYSSFPFFIFRWWKRLITTGVRDAISLVSLRPSTFKMDMTWEEHW